MSSKLQLKVILVKQTGHVLAAFTCKADPEGKPSMQALVGAGLIVRNINQIQPTPTVNEPIGETLVVPPEGLDIAVVDYEPAIFSNPRSFVAGGDKVAKLGSDLPTLDLSTHSVPSGNPPLLPAGSPPLINFSTTRVTVLLDTNTVDDKGACVILQEADPLPGNDPERRIAQGAIKSGTHFISLDLKTSPEGSVASIPNKDFFVLVLIAGLQPLFGKRPPHI
ncbi:MAG: hypothetical protein WBV94_15210 [Blastocatellia bacterium]